MTLGATFLDASGRSRQATTAHIGASRLALLVATACWGACNSVTLSENTLETCTQGRADEDGDGLTNCDDPDCFAFEACRLAKEKNAAGSAGSSLEPVPAGTGGAGGMLAAGTSGAHAVGGVVAPPNSSDAAADEDDAGQDMPGGGGGVVDPTDPCSACAATEMCVAEQCMVVPEPAPKEGAFTLYILEATAPVQSPLTTNCYDNACPSGVSFPYGICTCPPDPYVRVVLERGRREITIGETEVAENTTEATYSAAFDIDLEPGDVLRFYVMDEDEPFSDELMYICTPDLSMLQEGPLDCATGAGFLGADRQLIRAELVARAE